jgi:hypothetical protein
MWSLSVPDLDYQAAFSLTSSWCLDGQIVRLSEYPAASGGYADVWKGSLDNVPVAIKVMRPFDHNGRRIQKKKLLKVCVFCISITKKLN